MSRHSAAKDNGSGGSDNWNSSPNRHHQHTNTRLSTGWMSLHPATVQPTVWNQWTQTAFRFLIKEKCHQ